MSDHEPEILYRFRPPGGPGIDFPVGPDPSRVEPDAPPPEWTALESHRCPHCPLDPSRHPFCPVAVALAPLVEAAAGLVSYDRVEVEVVLPERRVLAATTAQRAISSLMGLLIARSACPHTAFFKPMARFHLPFATEEETVFRAASVYLLAQYFRRKEGREADLDLSGLRRIYEGIHETNVSMAARLRSASRTDSGVNALILLDLFAKGMPWSIDESLAELRGIFAPFLDGNGIRGTEDPK